MNSLTKKLAAGVIAAATMFSVAGLGATTANAANASDGSIEVSSSNAEFKGKTVTAYQMFTYDKEAVENGTATNSGYALISSWDDFFLHTVQVEGATAGNVSQKAYDYVASLKDTNVVNFAKKASDWVKSQKDFGASLKHEAIAAVNGNTYTATINNLSYGYYVVSPAAGSTDTTTKRGTDAMLLNVKNSTPVKQNLKSTYPTIQKTVQNGNEDSTHNSAQIGDTVNFKLASTVPDMAEYTNYTFKFTDTLSKGLTLNNTAATGNAFTAVVKIDGTAVDTGDYTATFTKNTISGTTSLEVNMTDFKTKHQHDAGKTITVEYSATLNTDAAVAGNGNDNTAKIIYSNDPSSNSTGETGEDKTYTYTFNFDINKVDADNTDTKLAGAQFELQDAQGHKIALASVNPDENSFRPKGANDTAAADTTVKTNSHGVLKFTGLKEGTYKVVETKAPAHYNKLTAPITVEIKANYNADGKLLNWGVIKSGETYDADSPATSITVENKKGIELPSTGGMGTALFTVFGVLIVALGAGWYVKSNRKSSKHAA
ncbi:SpaH/EbpB family LPXTG-anchored major pilin [Bifidobacterium longum]|uniref:SpaH/EbpB family LPXTG-anchored major pilin n=1 Tax=Bifidobacterium longum TaxID=216816 RepID=UPI001896D6E2|nr:SpaH/EbpB family LPXTG-anchored major pilin [Bifidobacterium longum]MDB6661559.1 SpaH/EbpB family LPXTG-anchored major pilin [Bifidobacterium longum]MDB6680488.1 SpaH/EbpB family LPXTG-anchored major pilin [Bifidobacterium longum]MDB6786091.1 SpaH/EbpB family LPXTG-anchored major pilin [Bifidobacterium longum]